MTSHQKERDGLVRFDWFEFMPFLIGNQNLRVAIGPAWLLFFDICMNADKAGAHETTYSNLAQRYGAAMITVKKWRRHLCKHSVMESFSKGHSVVFRLNEPFRSFLRSAEEEANPKRLLHKLLEMVQNDSMSSKI